MFSSAVFYRENAEKASRHGRPLKIRSAKFQQAVKIVEILILFARKNILDVIFDAWRWILILTNRLSVVSL